jgi:hypothetical protein
MDPGGESPTWALGHIALVSSSQRSQLCLHAVTSLHFNAADDLEQRLPLAV